MNQYFYPDGSERARVLPYLFRIALMYTVCYGEVYAASPNLEGIAVWFRSEDYPISLLRLLCVGALKFTFRIRGKGTREFTRLGRHIDALHKQLALFRHWYLSIIGVEPVSQGKGHAGHLLRAMLARIDLENLRRLLYPKTWGLTSISVLSLSTNHPSPIPRLGAGSCCGIKPTSIHPHDATGHSRQDFHHRIFR